MKTGDERKRERTMGEEERRSHLRHAGGEEERELVERERLCFSLRWNFFCCERDTRRRGRRREDGEALVGRAGRGAPLTSEFLSVERERDGFRRENLLTHEHKREKREEREVEEERNLLLSLMHAHVHT